MGTQTQNRFLYQGREVSYTSVLDRSISSRRERLYQARGFDLELWTELIAERKNLTREIGRIAEDYNESRDQRPDGKDSKDTDNERHHKVDSGTGDQGRRSDLWTGG